MMSTDVGRAKRSNTNWCRTDSRLPTAGHKMAKFSYFAPADLAEACICCKPTG